MYIITPNNELFEYGPDPHKVQALYHSEEVSILVSGYQEAPSYYASLRGKVNGIRLYTGGRMVVPILTNRRADQGPLIPERITPREDAPILGEIPLEHKELLIEAITRLAAYPIFRNDELIRQLTQTKQRLKNQT